MPELQVGGEAPQLPGISLLQGLTHVSFLRHIGCPFAEATVRYLRDTAPDYSQLNFILVTHGEHKTAEEWLSAIGGLGSLRWLHDPDRELYGKWGIGYSGLGHVLSPKNFIDVLALRKLGIKNRDASGTRWQRSATFLIKDNQVLWKSIPATANIVPSINEALEPI